jgi:hypothetical protein
MTTHGHEYDQASMEVTIATPGAISDQQPAQSGALARRQAAISRRARIGAKPMLVSGGQRFIKRRKTAT